MYRSRSGEGCSEGQQRRHMGPRADPIRQKRSAEPTGVPERCDVQGPGPEIELLEYPFEEEMPIVASSQAPVLAASVEPERKRGKAAGTPSLRFKLPLRDDPSGIVFLAKATSFPYASQPLQSLQSILSRSTHRRTGNRWQIQRRKERVR